MTRRINAIGFRLGINQFWKDTYTNFFLSDDKKNLFVRFYVESFLRRLQADLGSIYLQNINQRTLVNINFFLKADFLLCLMLLQLKKKKKEKNINRIT